jgi:GAF domain-containing protein
MVNIDPDALFKAQQRLTSSETSQEEKEILRTLLLLIRQQASELDALKRISVNLTSTLNLGNVLMIVAREAIILVKNASSVHIFLFQNNKLKFGTSLDIYGKVNEKIADPRPEGLTVTVVQTGGTVIVEDMQNHPLYTGAPKSWTGSIIGIPLKMGTRVVGVMNLSRSKTGSFSREELRLLQLLADQAASAIINAAR